MSQNYLINTREMAAQALRRRQAGPESGGGGELMPCVVVGPNGDGYDVQTLDDQGEMGRLYERVFPFPVTELSEGQEAWLWLPGDGETPLVLVAGGAGAGTCYASVFNWGLLG